MKMKRFFTLFMAIWALLSISQAVKAADVTVYFQCPSDWTTPVHVYAYNSEADRLSSWDKAPACTAFNTTTGVTLWKCSFDSKYKYVIFKANTGNQQYPTQGKTGFEVVDNHVYTSKGDKGSLSDFEKTDSYTYTLIGGYDNGSWTSESSSFKYDGASKYTYTFTAAQTGEFRFRVNTTYTSGAALCPNVDANTKRKELTSASDAVAYNDQKDASGNLMSDNYWFCKVTNGKKYTFTLTETYNSTDNSYTRKLSVVSEEAVVTKVIKLFNGSSELTGSNGKYTLDLSSATADATITLTIDGTTYGLAAAQTISAAGTTSDIAFTAEGTEALTLKAGLIYSLTVTEDGKMTVVAKEKGVSNGNYYLVGNFFDKDYDKINYDKKYFRFTNNKGDGTLTFDIPASLTIKAQVYGADGKCYGPVDGETGYGISVTHPTAAEKSVGGELVEGNCWTFTKRGLEQTGIYTITITVDAAGTPTKWNVTYDKSKRMAYFLVDPNDDSNAVVHPTYAVVKADRSSNNNFFGNIYLKAGQHCFVVGNIKNSSDDNVVGHPLTTTEKLYLQGNGGLDPTTNIDGSEKAKYTNVLPNKAGFTYNETKLMLLEYNPTRGNGDAARLPENHGICGEILKASNQITTDPITSVQIVGTGVVGSWDLGAAKEMKYNDKLDCWECTITTTNSESDANKFRFIANGSWKYNWGEDSKESNDQARTPYTDKTMPGHEASLNDPNELGFTTAGTAEERNGEGTYGDIIFNRPAGEWTIRLYTRTLNDENGSDNYVAKHAYTITGREYNGIPLTYRAGKFIRTYSNNVAMDIIDPNVKVYEAYKYTMPDQVENIYSQGTLELRQLKYIPANMGVVLIGTVPATEAGKYKGGEKLNFSISKRTETSAVKDEEYVDVWTKADEYKAKDEKWNNFLVPTVEAINDLGNVKKDQNDKITYRFYCLGNYHRTNYYQETHKGEDYIGFFRMTPDGVSGANKAYLSLPTSEDLPGGKYGYIDYNGQFIGTGGETALAKMMLVFDDETSGVTEIKNVEVNKQNNDNAYYTLQGIKILKPTKGIFIHNGKKIVIK